MSIKENFLKEANIGKYFSIVVGPKEITGQIIALEIDTVKIKNADGNTPCINLDSISFYEEVNQNIENLSTASFINSEVQELNSDQSTNSNEVLEPKENSTIDSIIKNQEESGGYKFTKNKIKVKEIKELVDGISQVDLKKAVMPIVESVNYAFTTLKEKSVNEYKISENINKLNKIISKFPNNKIPYDLLGCIFYKCKYESMALEKYKLGTDYESGFSIADTLNSKEDLDFFAVRHFTGVAKFNPTIILYLIKRMVELDDFSPVKHINSTNPDNVTALCSVLKIILKYKNIEYNELLDYDATKDCLNQLIELSSSIVIEPDDSLYKKYGINSYSSKLLTEREHKSEEELNYATPSIVTNKSIDVTNVHQFHSKMDYYLIAKEAELEEKDFSKAITYYKEAIKRGIRLQGSIPDLVCLYNRLEMYDEALDLLEKYRTKAIDRNKYLNLKHMIFSKAKNPKYADQVNLNMEELISLAKTEEKKNELKVYRAVMFSQMKFYEKSLSWLHECLKFCVRKNYSSQEKYQVQKLIILNNICNIYFKLDDIDNAKSYAKKVLEINNNNQFAINILNDIHNVEEPDEQEEIFGSHHIYTYILEKLEKLGLESEIKNKKVFRGEEYIGNEEETKRIVEGINGRPMANEEAKGNSFLAAAKLIKFFLDKDKIYDQSFYNEKKYNSYIGKSCCAFGNAEIYKEESYLDTARSFFLQAIEFHRDDDKFDKNFGISVYRYIQSLFCSVEEIKQDERSKNKYGKAGISARIDSTQSLNKEIENILFQKQINVDYDTFVSGIIDFLQCNKTYEELIFNFLNSENCPSRIYDVLEAILGSEINRRTNSFNIKEYWIKINSAYKQKRSNFRNAIEKVVTSIHNLGDFRESLDILKSQDIEHLFNLYDKNNINKVFTIFDLLLRYSESSVFTDKEDSLRKAEDYSKTLVERICQSPTFFSYERLKPEIDQIQAKIFKESRELFSGFLPEISVKQDGDCTVKEKNRLVRIPISITNKNNSQNADNLSISIKKGEDVEEYDVQLNKKILLGDGRPQAEMLEITVSPAVLESSLLSVEIEVSYQYKKSMTETEQGKIKDVIQVTLSKDKEFVPIDNKFEIYRNGAEVKDKSMFYGRDEDIEQIIRTYSDKKGNLLKNKCLALYGQTRTGKSSLLYHIEERLRKQNSGKNIIIHLGSIGSQNIDGDDITSFLYSIIDELERELKRNHKELYSSLTQEHIDMNPDVILDDKQNSMARFNNIFKNVVDVIDNTGSQYNIIITVDEFTYIYDWIRKGTMTDRIMKFWKAFIQNNPVFAIIIGQDHMEKFINDKRFTNDFGSTDHRKVTYLNKEYAQKLMYEPIMLETENGAKKSRFQTSALDRLYELTSGSAYLIMILCAGLVDYVNENKISFITLAHVEDYLRKNLHKFTENYFEPQYQDKGELDSDESIKNNKKMLLKIAQFSNNKEWAALRNVKNSEEDMQILNNLSMRDVIEIDRGTQCKIKVALYKEWLLNKYGTENTYENFD